MLYTFAAPSGKLDGADLCKELKIIKLCQYCKLKAGRADGCGYYANRKYAWAGIVNGTVEITDTVTGKVTYESNASFDRNFIKLICQENNAALPDSAA